jgi:hypothetical protein
MSNHVSLVTDGFSHYLGVKGTNPTSATTVVNKYATTTAPTTGSGSIVVPGSKNYLKIHPWWTSGANTPVIRVIGWSQDADALWIPHLLAYVTCTVDTSSSGTTINGATLKTCATITVAAGDAKTSSSSGLNTGSWLMVDTAGFKLVEVAFKTTTTAVAFNAHFGEI